MIHFEGDRSFRRPVAEVFAKLADASFLVGCLKNVDRIIEKSPDKAVWNLRPGFSFIRTTLEITLDIVERVANALVKTKMYSKGIGASSTVLSAMTLLATEDGCKVHWTADVIELTGLLRLVPKGLISSSAGKIIEESWAEIEQQLK